MKDISYCIQELNISSELLWSVTNIAVWKVKKDELGLSKFLLVFSEGKKKKDLAKFMLKTLENILSFSSKGKSDSFKRFIVS